MTRAERDRRADALLKSRAARLRELARQLKCLGFQALVHVIGEGMTVAAWSLREPGAPWRLNNDSAMGAFKCALAAIVGFYGPDLKRGNLRVRQRA